MVRWKYIKIHSIEFTQIKTKKHGRSSHSMKEMTSLNEKKAEFMKTNIFKRKL